MSPPFLWCPCLIRRDRIARHYRDRRELNRLLSMPDHVLASKPGMPVSSKVGSDGAAALRLPLLIASVGQTLVLISGGIDLSMGSVIALASIANEPIELALTVDPKQFLEGMEKFLRMIEMPGTAEGPSQHRALPK